MASSRSRTCPGQEGQTVSLSHVAAPTCAGRAPGLLNCPQPKDALQPRPYQLHRRGEAPAIGARPRGGLVGHCIAGRQLALPGGCGPGGAVQKAAASKQ